MTRKFFILHIASFTLAAALSSCLLLVIFQFSNKEIRETKIIHGQQKKNKGLIATLKDDEQAEIDFLAGLQNPQQIMLFGSSELVASPYAPFVFIPDTIGTPLLAIGHGFHQCFSIYTELLAGYEYLENSKICIILSPTWFATEGTNAESFLEYATPNFLEKILLNDAIDPKYKHAIAKFILKNKNDFTTMSSTMEYFIDEYSTSIFTGLGSLYSALRKVIKSIHPSLYNSHNVVYQIDPIIPTQNLQHQVFSEKYLKTIQNIFTTTNTNNDIYISNDYYTKYVENQGDEGADRIGIIGDYSLNDNAELNDFKLLVELLDEKNADCSFIIQPLNPHFYLNLDYNNPLIDSLTRIMNEHEMPYLNMYVTDTASYEPGTLRDIMHMGDLGWMRINNFLIQHYVNEK